MIKYIKRKIAEYQRAKEIKIMELLPRYIKAIKCTSKGPKEVGFDLAKYYIDYTLKTRTLKLTSKKNGKRIHLVLHKDGKYYV